MDPDAALEEIRQLCRTSDSRLAELISGLDEWLSRGGFKPADWQTARVVSPALRIGVVSAADLGNDLRASTHLPPRYDVVEGTPPMPRGERRG